MTADGRAAVTAGSLRVGLAACIALGLAALACAALPRAPVAAAASPTPGDAPALARPARPFDFARDTFAFDNELYWVYEFSEDGGFSHRPREGVENGQRCTAMARLARQFHRHARFAPELQALDRAGYAERVRRVAERDPRRRGRGLEAVVFPAFPDLRSFSREHADLVKEALGGPWRSYVQRGNWRMVFPFAPSQQRATAEEILAETRRGGLPILRLVTFPEVRVNHTVLVFGAEAGPSEIRFAVYDPNDGLGPTELVFERAPASFSYASRDYFAGGRVKAYQIYHDFFF